MTNLNGVFPVVPTPFDDSGAVDLAAFRRLIGFALAAGVDGLVFPGMASEVETLSPSERATLVAELGRVVAGRVPLIVGASDADPARAAARAQEGKAAGAVAAMVMAPHGLGQDIDALITFYHAVAADAGLPIMLQNAPAPNGAGLSPEAVATIAKAVPGVRFLKEETLPCGQHITRIRAAAGNALDGIYGGAGARYLIDELRRGASGTMPALELADVHVALWRAWVGGDQPAARRLYQAALPLLTAQAVFRVRLTKEVLLRRGVLTLTHARAKGPVPDGDDLTDIAVMLGDLGETVPLMPAP
jgi:4-hydroxy-tetrahydrodipicolinate synthase